MVEPDVVGFGAIAELIRLPTISIIDRTWLRVTGLILVAVASAVTITAQVMMVAS